MDLAELVSTRSKCSRRQVGAAIVDADNKHLISIGYNGAPSGFPEGGTASCAQFCPRASQDAPTASYGLSCVSVHAEINCILAARQSLENARLYVNSAMCGDCAKVIANSGIKTVVMYVSPSDAHRQPEEVIRFLEKCGLDVSIIEVV